MKINAGLAHTTMPVISSAGFVGVTLSTDMWEKISSIFGTQLLIPFTSTPLADGTPTTRIFSGLATIALSCLVLILVSFTLRVHAYLMCLPATMLHTRKGVVLCRKRFPFAYFRLSKSPANVLCDCGERVSEEIVFTLIGGTKIFLKDGALHNVKGPAVTHRKRQWWFWEGNLTTAPSACQRAIRDDLTEREWENLAGEHDYVARELMMNNPHCPEYIKILLALQDIPAAPHPHPQT